MNATALGIEGYGIRQSSRRPRCDSWIAGANGLGHRFSGKKTAARGDRILVDNQAPRSYWTRLTDAVDARARCADRRKAGRTLGRPFIGNEILRPWARVETGAAPLNSA
jgi:hypothetical protein